MSDPPPVISDKSQRRLELISEQYTMEILRHSSNMLAQCLDQARQVVAASQAAAISAIWDQINWQKELLNAKVHEERPADPGTDPGAGPGAGSAGGSAAGGD